MSKTANVLLQIAFLFVVPVALLYFGLIPIEARLWVLAIFLSFAAILALDNRRTARALGFRSDNLRRCALPYLLFTLGGLCFIATAAFLLDMERVADWEKQWHFIILFLPISAAQEFLYRGYLMSELRRLLNSAGSVILVNAALFALLHFIYPDAWVMIPLAAVAGISFAAMYQRYPNIFLISISHAALNFAATLYSFFNLQ